jgi:hypothetical protein
MGYKNYFYNETSVSWVYRICDPRVAWSTVNRTVATVALRQDSLELDTWGVPLIVFLPQIYVKEEEGDGVLT